jgi:hypothetical protein
MIFVTSGDWEISSSAGADLMTFALELEREFRVAIDLSFFGLEGVPLDRRPSELPFPRVLDGGGVELLDGNGVAVCFTDRVEARDRVFVAL